MHGSSRRNASAVAAATFAIGLVAGGLVVTAMTGQRASPAETKPSDIIAAAPPPAPAPTTPVAVGRYTVDVLRVIDGDTFEARVHVWPGFDLTTRVRLRGIDAPEMRARCGDERTRAEAALDALRTMLAERDVTVAAIGPDKYFGRVVADVSTRRTPDVSAALLAKGVARSYSGGRRESWCEARNSG